MMNRFSKLISCFLISVFCITPILNTMSVFAQSANNTGNTTLTLENEDFIRSEIQRLNNELAQLERLMPEKTRVETPLEERRTYVQTVVDVLAQIEALELKLKEQQNGGDDLADGELGSGKGRVLILTDILYKGKPHNKAGYVYENCDPSGCDRRSSTYTTRVEEYPSVIRLDEAFDVMASKTVRYRKKADLGTITSNANARINIAVSSVRGNAIVNMDSKLGGGRSVKEAYDVKGRASLRMSFEPLPIEPPPANMSHLKAGKAGFKFSSENLEGNHVNNAPSRVGKTFSFWIPAKGQEPSKLPVIRIVVGEDLLLFYKWGKEDDTPATAEQIPDDGGGNDTVADAGDDDRSDGSTDGRSGEGSEHGANSGSDPNDPNAQRSPDNPRVQDFITQWINSAEPPQNATEGAKLKYEQWGRIHGTTETGVITLNGNPDYAASYQSHFHYLWGAKDKLDSVDHCTLGEFIDYNMSGVSTTQCLRRYKPIVPDLIGTPVANAKKRLTYRKLNPTLKLGSEAPDQTKAMTVEKQSTMAGQSLDKQTQVTLTVYRPYVDKNILSNYVGKPAPAAKEELEAQGYEVTIKTSTRKPTRASQSEAVKIQFPKAGTQVKEGSKVTLTAYSTFIRKVRVPKLVGLHITAAQQKLEPLGLTANILEGSEAMKVTDSQKVEKQLPRSGKRLEEGSTITLTVHPDYIPTTTVPNVEGLTASEANSKIKAARLKPNAIPGPEAAWPEESERVIAQSIPAGTVINKGSQISFEAFAKYIPPVRVPSLVGFKKSAAKRKLRVLKIKPSFYFGEVTQSLSQASKVYNQSIQPGTLVKPGTPIELTIFDGRAAQARARQQAAQQLAAGLGALSTALAAANGSYSRGGYTGFGGGYSSFNDDPEAHHLPGYNSRSRRRNNTARTLTAVGAGLTALSNSMAAAQARQPAPSYTPPPSNGYGGITTNQSRQQMASTSVSGSVVSSGSGSCGVGYSGGQRTFSGSLGLKGISYGGSTIKFEHGSPYQKGSIYTGTTAAMGSARVNVMYFIAMDAQALPSLSFSASQGQGYLPGSKVIKSPTRGVYVHYITSEGSPSTAKGLACQVLKALEPYAVSLQSQSQAPASNSSPSYGSGGYYDPNVKVPYHGNDSLFGM